MDELGHTKIDLFKIDIEGSEFSVINKALLDKLNIRQMCIDHHEHMFENGNSKLKELVPGIHRNNYMIFYTENDIGKNRTFSCIKKDEIGLNL